MVSDDCTPVYRQQPGCTQVIEGMQRLGYRPVSDTPCTPPHPRLRPSHYCELEVLFVQPGLPAASHEPYFAFHSIHAKCAASIESQSAMHGPSARLLTSRRVRSGCSSTSTYTARTAREAARPSSAPSGSGQVVATMGALTLPGETRRRWLHGYVSRRWVGLSAHAHGTVGYTCPQACFAVGNVSAEMADVHKFKRGHCPWH